MTLLRWHLAAEQRPQTLEFLGFWQWWNAKLQRWKTRGQSTGIAFLLGTKASKKNGSPVFRAMCASTVSEKLTMNFKIGLWSPHPRRILYQIMISVLRHGTFLQECGCNNTWQQHLDCDCGSALIRTSLFHSRKNPSIKT
eukprot:s188_g46.t1